MSIAALLAALPWLLIWPTLLYVRSPALFSDWLWLNNVGRFLGFTVPTLGAANDDGFWAKNLVWIAFPATPLAMLSLWRARHALRDDEMLQATAMFSLVILGVLLFSASARGGYALPLLVPLSLLGAASVTSLPRRVENWWRWTARSGFSGLTLLIWLAWAGVMWDGVAPGMPFLRSQLAPDLDRHVHVATISFSALASLAAAFLMWHPRRQSALQTWVVGIATCWLSLASLFLPWADQVKSYKAVFGSLSAALPASANCVASRGLNESERTMLSYYHGLITERLETTPDSNCRVLLGGRHARRCATRGRSKDLDKNLGRFASSRPSRTLLAVPAGYCCPRGRGRESAWGRRFVTPGPLPPTRAPRQPGAQVGHRRALGSRGPARLVKGRCQATRVLLCKRCCRLVFVRTRT